MDHKKIRAIGAGILVAVWLLLTGFSWFGPAKEISEAVYVAAAYKDANGTVWTSGVLGYSIGSYCSSQVSKGADIAGLAKATAVYGYHAKQYFG